jgi:uncharacterized protein involved in exopolysaccharide biosynthesis
MKPILRGATGSDEQGGELFDYARLKDYVGFITRSAVRHRGVVTATFLATVALAGFALWALPKTYRVETRILAQRNPMMSVIANPGFGRPWEADAPTRAARETVLRWKNMLELVRQTGLAEQPTSSRAPAVRLRAWVDGMLAGHPLTLDERVDSLAYTLEKKLKVDVGEGTVVISLDWDDPGFAYRVVEAALQNFLEARHANEIAMVGEALAILQSHLATLDHEIGDLEALANQAGRIARPPASHASRPGTLAGKGGGNDGEEISKLRSVYASKQRAIADLEDFRKRRLAELQEQLTQVRSVYADMHPSVLATRQSIQSLGGPSPQVDALTAEADGIEREVLRLGGTLGESRNGARSARRPDVTDPSPPAESLTPQQADARSELRVRYTKRTTLVDRIDSARLEMDTAQAAFKYRYVVLSPPQEPRRPIKPNAALVWVGSVLGGAILALLTAAAVDLRSGRILERWQVERSLQLPVLAELNE